MRLSSQPGENNWDGSMKAGAGRVGPDTREVRDTLASYLSAFALLVENYLY